MFLHFLSDDNPYISVDFVTFIGRSSLKYSPPRKILNCCRKRTISKYIPNLFTSKYYQYMLNNIIAHIVILHCVLGQSHAKIQINIQYYQRNHDNASEEIIHKYTFVFMEFVYIFSPISQKFPRSNHRAFPCGQSDDQTNRRTDRR